MAQWAGKVETMPTQQSLPTGPQQATLQEAPHRNHGLFSDHYLNDTLPGRADWHLFSQSAEVAGAMAEVKSIFAAFAAHAENSNEAQTDDGFIKPVLRALGHNTF